MLLATLRRIPGFLVDSYHVRRGRTVLPRLLTYTVTFRCNARCIMCDSWKIQGHNDLKIEEVEAIFKQLPRMDGVRLTGGEPFVRQDLLEITELAIRYLKPLGIHITTNGFLTDRIVELCTKRPRKTPLQIMVSLDGLKDKHNHIRGSNVAFNCAMKTIEELSKIKGKLNLDLAVNQTIVDEEGIEHYELLKEKLGPLGVRHQMVMAYDSSATYSVERNRDVAPKQVGQFTTFGQIDGSKLKRLFDGVQADLKTLPWWARLAKSYYLKGIQERLLSDPDSTVFTNPACVALNSHLRIFPNGDIPTCQFNSKIVGNLRERSFEEVWKSASAHSQREWVGKCPGCWAECEVLPNALYSLDLIKPL
ncbi:MAG: radical SAM/SPASM domain-containing protein [Planctomycetota bacterium]|jgi:MoaA/NifB/PqqE/SkfB family radical SAM enzyme